MAYDVAVTERYIRDAARARGIDPDTAVRVAKSEGLASGVYQSNLAKGGQREPSYGPFQLLVGGAGTNYPAGMGNDFIRQTGLDPRDPSTVNQQVDFALDNAAKNGWGAWYGAAKAGIDKRDGIGGNAAPRSSDIGAMPGAETTAGYPSGADMNFLQTPEPSGLGGIGGFGGLIQNPETRDMIRAMGMSLMSSPSNNPLASFGTNYTGLSDRRERREESAADRQAMMGALQMAGMSPDEAAGLARNPQAAQMILNQRSDERKTAQAQSVQNRTADWAEQQGHPDIAEAIRTGVIDGAAGFKEVQARAKGPNGDDAKVVGSAVYIPSTGEWIYPPNEQGGGGLFEGKGLGAQGLNYLVKNGRLTEEQAASIAAGKTITDEEGRTVFATPQGIMAQQPGGEVTPIAGGPAAAAGDGASPGMIPLTGPKVTLDEKKAMTFADRMTTSGAIIDSMGTAGTSLQDRVASKIPVAGDYLVSDEYKNIDQARRDFINAQLRRESGAVIGADEFDNANKQYFPQPGDGPEVLEQKRKNREIVIQGMQRDSGSTYTPPKTAANPLKDKYGLE